MILVINTADTKKVFIALVQTGKLIVKREFLAQYRQAEKLLSAIDKLLASLRLSYGKASGRSGQAKSYSPRFACLTARQAGEAGKLKTLKGIVVVSGPGPFTALRIGVATANTLAWALNIPIVGYALDEFKDIQELAKIAENKIKKAKRGVIIEPFYGKEPNITLKR